MKKKQMTMRDVFKDLPKGYWRTAENKTLSLKDMDIDHLKNVSKFLKSKRYIFNLIKADPLTYEDDLIKTFKFPSDLDYVIKILEVNAEIKRRRGRTE